jgi:hypothetical protein
VQRTSSGFLSKRFASLTHLRRGASKRRSRPGGRRLRSLSESTTSAASLSATVFRWTGDGELAGSPATFSCREVVAAGRPGFQDELRMLAGRQPSWRTIPEVLPGGARLATKLLSELDELGGLSTEFIDALRMLAASERRQFATLRNRGGDRRSGERTLKTSVLGMIVRLYCEAHARPGGKENGPLFRFANAVGELALGKREPFSPGAVRGEFRRMKPRVRRPPGLRALYRNTTWREP